MARIAGVDLPREKRVEIGLTYIYGIGRVSADRTHLLYGLLSSALSWIFYQFLNRSDPGQGIYIFSVQELY